jgi:hypothetical protein
VANHILGDIDGDVFLAVIDGEGLLDESGIDGRTARPSLDDLFLAGFLDRFNLLEKVASTNGPFLLERDMFDLLSLLIILASHDETGRILLEATSLDASGASCPKEYAEHRGRQGICLRRHRVGDRTGS